MKLAFLFGRLLHAGRTLNFDRLWHDDRGLTGSEVACIAFAIEMSHRHDVTFFCPQEGHVTFETNIRTDHLDRFPRRAGEFDAVLSWCEPDLLRAADPRSVRLCNQQLNDFAYCRPGFDDVVDVWTSPSQTHRDFLVSLGQTTESKWRVLPNGCYPNEYSRGARVEGRCVYTSSPDRGLHLVLQEWPSIRKAVPHATLRIFYFALERWLAAARPQSNERGPVDPRALEHRLRAQYVESMLKRLGGMGVEVIGGVSRTRLAHELGQARLLTYPCDTIAWTEGFSCATLEGCAAGALPIISRVDALGQIYGGAVPMVDAPAHKHMAEWREFVIRALRDEAWRSEWAAKAKALAQEHDWSMLAAKLDSIIDEAASAKRAPVTATSSDIVLHMTLTAAAALPAKTLEVEHPERDEHGGGARAGFLGFAKSMAARPGYRVVAYCPVDRAFEHAGVQWVPISQIKRTGRPTVLLSYFDFSTLVERSGCLRIASHHSCAPYPGDPYDWADLNVAPSAWAVDFLQERAPAEQWAVLPNALAEMNIERRPVHGRVIHHAPPSRGLHLLLEVWPEIRKRVPEATLHVIGPLDEWMSGHYGRHELRTSTQGRRVSRIKAVLPKAREAGGLEILGQVPRTRLLQELSEAACFAYPCAPVAPCETWSITVHECLAAGVPVVLAPADALGELWSEGCRTVANGAIWTGLPADADVSDMKPFAQALCEVLLDAEYAESLSKRGRIVAAPHTFERSAEILDGLIRERL